MLGVTPATTWAPLPCPRAVIALDLRHASAARTVQRHNAACAQGELRPRVPPGGRDRMHLAADARRPGGGAPSAGATAGSRRRSWERTTCSAWARADRPGTYALAFGQWGNKNVGLVVEAWSILQHRGEAMPLVVVGLPGAARRRSEADVAGRNLADLVTVRPWLSADGLPAPLHRRLPRRLPLRLRGFRAPGRRGHAPRHPGRGHAGPGAARGDRGLATVMDGWDARGTGPAVPRVCAAARPAGAARASRTRRASPGGGRPRSCAPRWPPVGLRRGRGGGRPSGPAPGEDDERHPHGASAGGARPGPRCGAGGATA